MTTPEATLPTPPLAEHRETVREHHGDVVVDPFEWLRDKEDPAVRAHLARCEQVRGRQVGAQGGLLAGGDVGRDRRDELAERGGPRLDGVQRPAL